MKSSRLEPIMLIVRLPPSVTLPPPITDLKEKEKEALVAKVKETSRKSQCVMYMCL